MDSPFTEHPHSQPLSTELESLLEQAKQRPMSIADMEAALRGREYALLTMLLAAPFLIPSVPGLSTPFGLALMGMGWRLARGHEPWLPQFVRRRKLEPKTLVPILNALLRLVRWMELQTKARMGWVYAGPFQRVLMGLAVISGGSFLFLPIMVPVMNTLPALSLLFLSAGMMEDDGVFIAIGYVLNVAAWVYLGGWIWFGKACAGWLCCLWG